MPDGNLLPIHCPMSCFRVFGKGVYCYMMWERMMRDVRRPVHTAPRGLVSATAHSPTPPKIFGLLAGLGTLDEPAKPLTLTPSAVSPGI